MAYVVRCITWSSDVCSSYLLDPLLAAQRAVRGGQLAPRRADAGDAAVAAGGGGRGRKRAVVAGAVRALRGGDGVAAGSGAGVLVGVGRKRPPGMARPRQRHADAEKTERTEEHKTELQSLRRISYTIFCLKKNKENQQQKESDKHV